MQATRIEISKFRKELKDNIQLKKLKPSEINKYGKLVLQIQPKDRKENEIELLNLMVKTNRFFSKMLNDYGEETYTDMLKCIYVECIPEGEVLFEFGSIGYEFFIILQGQVSIYIKLKEPDYENKKEEMLKMEEIEPTRKTFNRWKSKFDGVPKSPNNVHSTVLKKEDGYHVVHDGFWMKNINSIRTGASFGEAAIMGKEIAMRNATIFCKRNCVFAVLDKDNFQRIIGEYQQRITMEKVNFLKKVGVFSQFLTEELKTMIYSLELKNYGFREMVFSQGSEIDQIYIIKKGEVKLTKNKFLNLKEEESKQLKMHLRNGMTNKTVRRVEIAVLGVHQSFGHECIFFDLPTEFEAVSTTSDTEM